jgi:hypothetical protein
MPVKTEIKVIPNEEHHLIGFTIHEKIGVAMYNPSVLSKVTFDGGEEDGELHVWNRKPYNESGNE